MTDTQQSNVLAYSVLPAGSRLTAQATEHGVIITLPPPSLLSAMSGFVFAALFLLPMTFGLVFAFTDSNEHFDLREWCW